MEDADVRIRDSCSARKILLPYPASRGVKKGHKSKRYGALNNSLQTGSVMGRAGCA
jgi:hypothetical protein